MNSIRSLYTMLLVGLVTLSLGFSAMAEDVSGTMMVVKGDVKVTSKDGKTAAGKVGKKVAQGDTIIAGADARAKIVMSDKNVLNVSPDSKIVIEKYENSGDKKNVELNVVYGKVRAAVEQKYDGEKSKFNIKTPSAVAGVRGTDFMMGYNSGTKVSQVVTFSGSVAVGLPGPGGTIANPVFVQPGQMTEAGSGQAPSAPKSVPKEDLNKMNSDTKSEAAAPKKDEPKQQADKKDEGKREEAKKDDGKKSDSGPAASKDEPKKDRSPASETSNTATSASAAPPPPPPPPPDISRAPNGAGGPMITTPTLPPTIPTLPVQAPTNQKSNVIINLQPQ